MSEKEKVDHDLDRLFSMAENQLQEELGILSEEAEKEEAISPEEMPEELKVEGPAGEVLDEADLSAFEEVQEDVSKEPLEEVQIQSVIESLLLATDRPLTMGMIKEVFKGTYTKTTQIRRALEQLAVNYAGAERGIMLEEVAGGYQLRTKEDNRVFVRRMTKARPFRLSGQGLEVLSIIAYKQPIIKAEIDMIRGVESGHLVRALMDRGIVRFAGKSEQPGKPMLYGTTRKFLEIFGLRDLRELPTLAEINELIPEGIGEEDEEEKETLSQLTDGMSMHYSEDMEKEGEFERLTDEIANIATTSDFFEQEKERQRRERDEKRAEFIRDMVASGAEVEIKEVRWLERYEEKLAESVENDGAVLADTAENGEVVTSETVEPLEGESLEMEAQETQSIDERLREAQLERATEAFESDDGETKEV